MRIFCVVSVSAIWLLVLALLPGEGLAQGDGKQRPRTAAPRSSTARTPAPVLSDESLQKAIARRFAQSKIGANGFSVSVSGGRATLRGVAQVSQHKGVATRLAKAAGAREVINQIEISPEARAKAKAGAKNSPRRPPQARTSARGGAGARESVDGRAPARSPRSAPVEAKEFAPAAPPGLSDSVKEPEAFEGSQASEQVGSVKRFRILSGQPSGKAGADEAGSGEQVRRRRY